MANKTLPELPASPPPLVGTEIVETVVGGDSVSVTTQQIANVAIGAVTADLGNTTDPNLGVSIVPTAIALATSSSNLQSRNVNNQAFLTLSPVGNVDSFAQYTKTGNNIFGKAGTSEPPYIYDLTGNEYIEKRPISFQHIPQIILDESPKLVAISPFVASQVVVALRKKDVGYILVGLANNITTNASDSLGTSGTDPTMRRVVNVQSAVSVVMGNIGTPTLVGAWTSPSLNAVSPEIPAFTSSSSYIYRSSTVQNASLTYSAMSPVNGAISLSFLCSPGSTPIATISVDGVSTNFDLTAATSKIRTFRFPVNKDSVPVVITNAYVSGTPSLNFLGQDFSTLALWKGAAIDTWGYYRNSAVADYIISNSENDYTMKEYVTQIYGGGYHGGESAITDVFKVDGTAYTPILTPKACSKLSISSTCNISWATVGSTASVSVRKEFEFAIAGYYCSVGITGPIVLAELYAALFGAANVFDTVDAPTPVVINNAIPNLDRLKLGRSTKVVMRNSATGQKITVNYTVEQNDYANQYGGIFIWRVDGTYNKLYYSPAHGGKLAITGNFACNRYEFSN